MIDQDIGDEFLTGALKLRTVLDLPVPPIYAYSLDPSNLVGIEYIIEEKATGMPLGSLWYQWSKESQLGLITQLVDLETKLASIQFRKHGCIYYKKNLEEKGLPIDNLEAVSHSVSCSINSISSLLTEFSLGPSTAARLWEGERETMDLDRGPCKFQTSLEN